MARLTTSTQVKVTLPEQLYFYLKSKSDRLGLTMSSYIKNLIIDDVRDLDIPVFKMSEKTEKKGLQALEEHKQGKTRKIDNISEFISKL